MKKILVPTDFKESAENALDAALQISAASDQEVLILLLNIIDPERFYKVTEGGEFIDASTDEDYRKHLVHQSGLRLEEIIEKKGGKNIVGKVETGDTAQIITDYVEKEDVDLLVKGIHRTSIYEEMLFSSNSQKIIHSVTCPVLTIRNKVENFTCANMAFATDLKADISAVEPQIKEIQKMFDSKIHFVYINTPGNFYNDRRINDMKESYFQQYSFENYDFHIYNDFTIETGIAHFSDDLDADVVAISAHHFNSLMDHIHGSQTSEIVVDKSERPVITFTLK